MDQSQGDRTGRPIRREGGVGLLVLDRDRFGSLSTRDPDRDGTLITSEIEAAGPVRLWVNAEGLGPDSRLRLELLDRAERPLPDYSGNRAAVVEKSGLRAPVSWADGSQIVLKGQPFKIRARLQGPERKCDPALRPLYRSIERFGFAPHATEGSAFRLWEDRAGVAAIFSAVCS